MSLDLTGYSVFETNIIVNERILPDGIRRRRIESWDVSKIPPGCSFPFGDQGGLVVMAPLSHSTLVTYWRSHRFELMREMKEAANEVILRREAGLYHREYYQTEPFDIRSIAILVVSERRESRWSSQS